MSDSVAASTLEAGRDAYARHAWSEAFELVSAADAEHELTAVDLNLLAYSAYEAARARLLVAQGHRTAGHHDAARRQLRAAASTFERLGARPDLARVQGEPGSPGRANTRRAREVLSLVADGLTDRQIAEQLLVSPHTVHRHLANIRNKRGQPTRAATVARAAELGLL